MGLYLPIDSEGSFLKLPWHAHGITYTHTNVFNIEGKKKKSLQGFVALKIFFSSGLATNKIERKTFIE